ncbi:MAG: SIS domain-containing protein [Erysipelotrichaceae bacterium]|nr:SIS domain-containing protein [Erysipelotrichaceae bacterium]
MNHEIEKMASFLEITPRKIDELLDRFDQILSLFKNVEYKKRSNLYLIGNGSSGEGARIASFLALDLFGKVPYCITPYQFTHYSYVALTDKDIVIAISQTGTSHEVVESLRLAKKAGATTIAITTIAHAPVAEVADIPVVLPECKENVDYKVVGVLGQLYGLWMVILGIGLANEFINQKQAESFLLEFRDLNKLYKGIADAAQQWTINNIDFLEQFSKLTVLGSGPLTETAMELAIKSIEVQNRFSMAVDTEEYLHGICAADPTGNLVIMLADVDTAAYSKKVYHSIKEFGQPVVYFGHDAPEGQLSVKLLDSKYFSTALFFPLVHGFIVAWAKAKDYGADGAKVFEFYQNKLKVREDMKK